MTGHGRAWTSSGNDVEPMAEIATSIAAERAALQAVAVLAAIWHAHAACREAAGPQPDGRVIRDRMARAVGHARRAAAIGRAPR